MQPVIDRVRLFKIAPEGVGLPSMSHTYTCCMGPAAGLVRGPGSGRGRSSRVPPLDPPPALP